MKTDFCSYFNYSKNILEVIKTIMSQNLDHKNIIQQ